VIALVVFLAALVVAQFYYILFGSKQAAPANPNLPKAKAELQSEASAVSKSAEVELDKKRKEMDALRKELNEAKDELKTAKKKLYEQTQADKGANDLLKARAEVERNASIQLENVRAELAQSLSEIERLRSDKPGSRRPAPAPVAVELEKKEAAPVEKPQVVIQRVVRELNDADREKMARLESDASKARHKASDLDNEVRKLKVRSENGARFLKVAQSELELSKDKFRAVEKRLNRVLLERDLLRRAIKDLEKKTGMAAERSELTQDEMAASDKSVEERQAAEAAAEKAVETAAAAAAKSAEEAAAAPAPAAPTETPSPELAAAPAAEVKPPEAAQA
jgi:chromosome segregation ATPase